MIAVPELLRTDAHALTPPIPFEFQAYVDEAQDGVQPVGRPGKIGVADVELKRDTTGRTGVGSRYVKAPMSLSKPLHVDPADPDVAVVYLRSTGGGVAQNDRIRQRFVLQPGAQAVVTTQASTSVHRMNSGFGSQWTSALAGEGAVLEYFPGHTTLFGGSRLVQLTEFELAPSAALIAGEVVMLGRLASGEVHQFDACSISTRVTRSTALSDAAQARGGGDNTVLLNDKLFAESRHNNANSQLFDEWPIWATLLVVPSAVHSVDVRELADELHKLGQQLVGDVGSEAIAIGASTLVDNSGVIVRIAGHWMDHVRQAMDSLHNASRLAVLGKTSFDLRRM